MLDTPLNDKVRKVLLEKYNQKDFLVEPYDLLNMNVSMKGGSLYNNDKNPYIRPTNSPSYPMWNLNEIKNLDFKPNMLPYQVSHINNDVINYQKKGEEDLNKKVVSQEGGMVVKRRGRPKKMTEQEMLDAGFISKKDLKKGWKFAKKNIVKPALKEGIKYAREPARAALMTLGVPKPIADIGVSALSNLAEKGVEGLGVKGGVKNYKKGMGIGSRSGGASGSRSGGASGSRSGGASGSRSGGASGSRSGGASGSRSGGANNKTKRGELVKKLMKEKKMNLGQASRYIKENNLM